MADPNKLDDYNQALDYLNYIVDRARTISSPLTGAMGGMMTAEALRPYGTLGHTLAGGVGGVTGLAAGALPSLIDAAGPFVNRASAHGLSDYFGRQAGTYGTAGLGHAGMAAAQTGMAAMIPEGAGFLVPGALANAKGAWDDYQKRKDALRGADMWSNTGLLGRPDEEGIFKR